MVGSLLHLYRHLSLQYLSLGTFVASQAGEVVGFAVRDLEGTFLVWISEAV